MRLVTLAAGLLLALPALADEMIVPGGGYIRAERGPADSAHAVPAGTTDDPARRPHDGAPAAAHPLPASRDEPARDGCRNELNAYLRELLSMAGIDGVEDPLALVAGLEASGAFGGPYRLAWAGGVPWPVDPVQPLAWSSELRRRARDVSACVRRAG